MVLDPFRFFWREELFLHVFCELQGDELPSAMPPFRFSLFDFLRNKEFEPTHNFIICKAALSECCKKIGTPKSASAAGGVEPDAKLIA